MPKVWLFSKYLDLILLFIPVWFVWGLSFLLPARVIHMDLPLWFWVVIILGLDVSHVWSTIFRTYFDKDAFSRNKQLLIATPVVVFALVFIVNYFAKEWFWTLMAHLAVYHFVKQQYGFLAIYKVKAKDFKNKWLNDKWIIYLSMVYPVVYWHLKKGIVFNWFAENDFFFIDFGHTVNVVLIACNIAYGIIIALWLIEELYVTRKSRSQLLYGKIFWFLTTAVNWYLGIVWFNSDFVFSLTNVVAHGVPYIALIIFYKVRERKLHKDVTINFSLVSKVAFFIVIVSLSFGFIEEMFWDRLVNFDKEAFFGLFISYPDEIQSTKLSIAVSVAVLSVPQVTHYILDGFIWKSNHRNPDLKKILFE